MNVRKGRGPYPSLPFPRGTLPSPLAAPRRAPQPPAEVSYRSTGQGTMDQSPLFLGMELYWPYVQRDDYISVLPHKFGLFSSPKYQFPTEIPVVQPLSLHSADANVRIC